VTTEVDVPLLKIQFSCALFTVRLVLTGNIIIEAAPIVRKFEGQPLINLISWVQSKNKERIIIYVLEEEQKPDLKELLKRVIAERI
jgi:uncharacterized protein YbcI